MQIQNFTFKYLKKVYDQLMVDSSIFECELVKNYLAAKISFLM